MNNKTPRELQIEKIVAIKQELKSCRKDTPHWRDLNRHLQKEKKELIIYDILRKGEGRCEKRKDTEKIH